MNALELSITDKIRRRFPTGLAGIAPSMRIAVVHRGRLRADADTFRMWSDVYATVVLVEYAPAAEVRALTEMRMGPAWKNDAFDADTLSKSV